MTLTDLDAELRAADAYYGGIKEEAAKGRAHLEPLLKRS
jgi:hypothetical protein